MQPRQLLLYFVVPVALACSLLAFWTRWQHNVEPLPVTNSPPRSMEERFDVVVVGAGLSGLSAALAASDASEELSILLVEKEERCGGNSAKATSGMNSCDTQHQRALGIDDTTDLFRADTLRSGGGKSDETLVDTLVEHSKEALEFVEKYADFDLSTVSRTGGHSVARTHRPPRGPVGFSLVKTLLTEVEKRSNVQVRNSAKMTKINANGVAFDDESFVYSKAVILATGGFAFDAQLPENSLVKQFRPDLADFPTTNGAFALGEGVRAAREMGAAWRHMDQIQVHPTGFVDPADPACGTKFLAPENLRAAGGVLVKPSTGERFVNELDLRSVVTAAIRAEGSLVEETSQRFVFLVLNDAAVDAFGPNFNFYYKAKKFFTKFETIAEAQLALFGEQGKLVETLTSYSAGETPFGKSEIPATFDVEAPVYVAKVTPSLHYSMGGLAIDEKARVLSESGDALAGVFAAGEVTGGLHGANRLAGNSLLETVVFGRIAGASAADYALAHRH